MTPCVPGDKRRSDSKLQIADPILLASNHSIPSCHGTTEKRRRFKRNSLSPNKHKTAMNIWRREIKGRHWLRRRKTTHKKRRKKKIRFLKRERSLLFFLLCLLKCQRPVGNDGGETVKYDIAVHHTQRYERGNTEHRHILRYFEVITLKQLV